MKVAADTALKALNAVEVPPVPTPDPVPTPAPAPVLRLLIGEEDGFTFTATMNQATPPNPANAQLSFFEVRNVETKMPSYKGARVGAYGDALLPTTTLTQGKTYWVDVKALAPGTISLFGVIIAFVYNVKHSWPFPFYMEMQFAQIARAHGLADVGETFTQRVALAKKYAGWLRAHGIEPIKHAPTVYPSVGAWETNTLAWRELVLDGRIHPPCLFGPAPTLPPSAELLHAIRDAIVSGKLPKDSFVYPWDEGEGNISDTKNALTRVTYIRTETSDVLRQAITRRPDPAFGNVTFIPVQNLAARKGVGLMLPNFWMYGSCMANGNCQNNLIPESVAPQTQFPGFAIDNDRTDLEDFVEDIWLYGASAGLYYNSTESMPTAFEPGGQYKFGNNGDGNFFYKDGVSIRLKYLRRGLNNVAWLMLAKQFGVSIDLSNPALRYTVGLKLG